MIYDKCDRHGGNRHPAGDVLDLAPAALASQVRAELVAAGLDPDATDWPRPAEDRWAIGRLYEIRVGR